MADENRRPVRPTELAHKLVRERLHAGDSAVDATAGNGHDTRFLAECVGATGRVYSFDIQEQAIESTARNVADMPWVELHQISHEHLSTIVESGVEVVMFNLGYLPSGDKEIITRPDTTIRAITNALDLLSPSGIVTIVVYPGHDGGDTEAKEVEAWIATLDKSRFSFENHRSPAAPSHAPYLLTVSKPEEH